MTAIDDQDLHAAFLLEGFDARAAQRLMEPTFRGDPPSGAADGAPREAAALAYVFRSPEGLVFPLTLRHRDLPEHRGQVSLPGGRPEPSETSWRTARREALEEIDLDERLPLPVGRLAPVYIPVTHTRLHVHVAVGPDPGPLTARPSEVERIALAPLVHLLEPARRRCEPRRIRGRTVDVPFFRLAGWNVWGATAIALSELAERLRTVVTQR